LAISNLAFGWLWITAGFLSGAIIGLYFRQPGYLGGYDALPRRLVRLGHISFYGLGSINIMYGLSKPYLVWAVGYVELAEWGLIIGALTMPAACFLTAWHEKLHYTFFIPVICLLYAGSVITWKLITASGGILG